MGKYPVHYGAEGGQPQPSQLGQGYGGVVVGMSGIDNLDPGQDKVHWIQGGNGPAVPQATSSLCGDVYHLGGRGGQLTELFTTFQDRTGRSSYQT